MNRVEVAIEDLIYEVGLAQIEGDTPGVTKATQNLIDIYTSRKKRLALAAHTDGYGYDYAPWDRAVAEKFKTNLERLGPHQRYGKVEIFRSPKGRWMAFHNPQYTDIRVVDLETGDVVAKDVYANFSVEPRVYDGFHANFTTFVPSYFRQMISVGTSYEQPHLFSVTEYDDNDFQTVDWDTLLSVPLAFNSYTYWAADHEFYVDVLDLRDIDDGKIHLLKGTGFTLIRSASHVRQFIKSDASSWVKIRTAEEREAGLQNESSAVHGKFVTDFTVLDQKEGLRLNFSTDGHLFDLHDYTKEKSEPGYKIERSTELPWVGVQRREAEYKAKKTAADQAVKNVEEAEAKSYEDGI